MFVLCNAMLDDRSALFMLDDAMLLHGATLLLFGSAMLLAGFALIKDRLQLNQGAPALFMYCDRQGLLAPRSPLR